MSSDIEFVKFVTDQVAGAKSVRYRAMFGGYTLYSNDKVVALICDNQLFVKPTQAGRAYIGNVQEAPPYPGAKNSFLIDEKLDDSEWLTALIEITESALLKPKPKKKKKKNK